MPIVFHDFHVVLMRKREKFDVITKSFVVRVQGKPRERKEQEGSQRN